MKKHIKKIIIILIILGLLYFLYTKFFSSENWNNENIWENYWPVSNLETLVEKKDFDSSISLKWTTKIKNEQSLRFNTAWRVLEVNYKVWDSVKLGQTLARIDSSEINTEIEKARLDLENAKDDLKKFVDDVQDTWLKKSNLDIESTKISLDQKEYNIKYLKQKQEKDLKEALFSLKEAKNNLEISKKEAKKNISDLWLNSEDRDKVLKSKELQLSKETLSYNDFKNNFENRLTQKINEYYTKLETNYINLENEISSLKRNLDDAAIIVWINNDNNEKFEYKDYFSAKNSTHIWKAKTYLYEAYSAYDDMKKSFNNIKNKKDSENIIKTLEISKKYYEAFYKASLAISKWYDDSVDTVWFTKTDISSGSSTYSSLASTASSKTTSLISTIDELKTLDSVEKIKKDLENELEDKKLSLENLKLEIKKTKENQDYIVWTSSNNIEAEKLKLQKLENAVSLQTLELEKLKKTQAEELSQAKIELEKSKLDYKDLLDKKKELTNLAENNDYKLKKNAVKQAQVSLEDSRKKLENYILKAPFDGKITKVDIKVWDRLNSDTEKYISVSDPDSIEINVSVNQSDIVKVKKWMKAEIKLNSYPNKVFSWSVLEVNTTPKEENGITKFDAKIVLKKPENVKIYSGLKAEVLIIASRLKGAIVVPFTSVETGKDWKRYVTVVKNWKNEKREVETGFTDWKFYEIKSWLKVWEEVLEIDYANANTKTEEKKKTDGNYWMDIESEGF